MGGNEWEDHPSGSRARASEFAKTVHRAFDVDWALIVERVLHAATPHLHIALSNKRSRTLLESDPVEFNDQQLNSDRLVQYVLVQLADLLSEHCEDTR
jgi:hypothetical protein